MSSTKKSSVRMMRVKKPLLSTYIFAGILIAGMIMLYILTSRALESDTAFGPLDTNANTYNTSS